MNSLLQWLKNNSSIPFIKQQKTILFIIGCQCSGTSLIQRIFERDPNTKSYGEISKLSSQDKNKLRLDPLSSVKATILKDKQRFIVLKPLVETQNALKLLDYFENSSAVWMFRDYKDVSLSSISGWGINTGIQHLRPIVQNIADNWTSENVPEDVRSIITKYFYEEMDPYDAAALFWYVRNRFFFDLGLYKRPNVFMCKYDDMVASPVSVIRKIYKLMGQKFPGQKITSEAHTKSISRGKDVVLSPEIDSLAKDLYRRLDKVYQEKNHYNLYKT